MLEWRAVAAAKAAVEAPPCRNAADHRRKKSTASATHTTCRTIAARGFGFHFSPRSDTPEASDTGRSLPDSAFSKDETNRTPNQPARSNQTDPGLRLDSDSADK